MITTASLERKAMTGDPDAQFRLGYRLAFSAKASRRHPQCAVAWWRRAAASGHTRAKFYLGVSLDQGLGVKKNLATAMHYYRDAAEAGHPEAQYNLAVTMQLD